MALLPPCLPLSGRGIQGALCRLCMLWWKVRHCGKKLLCVGCWTCDKEVLCSSESWLLSHDDCRQVVHSRAAVIKQSNLVQVGYRAVTLYGWGGDNRKFVNSATDVDSIVGNFVDMAAVWNLLSSSFKHARLLSAFISRMKTQLFLRVYQWQHTVMPWSTSDLLVTYGDTNLI